MSEPLPEYLSSARSLQVLTRAVGSRETAIMLLSDALRGGVILARGRPVRDFLGRLASVPPFVWRTATADDRQRWSWAGGAFGCSANDDLFEVGERDWEGVEFSTIDILDLCEEHGDPANLPSTTRTSAHEMKESPPIQSTDRQSAPRGGNPGKVESWHRFWLEAMTMLYDGDLDRSTFPTQKSLMDELRRRIDDSLSEESVKPHISKIWLKFVNREG